MSTLWGSFQKNKIEETQKYSPSANITTKLEELCGDNDIKQTTMELIEERIKDGMTMAVFNVTSQVGITYDKVGKAAAEDPEIREKLNEINNMYLLASPKLKAIRTIGIDDRLSIAQCAANVVYENGTTVPVEYQISKTTDNEWYVELFE